MSTEPGKSEPESGSKGSGVPAREGGTGQRRSSLLRSSALSRLLLGVALIVALAIAWNAYAFGACSEAERQLGAATTLQAESLRRLASARATGTAVADMAATATAAIVETRSEQRAAMSRALAAMSTVQQDRDPELAVLLAMEAISATRRSGEPVLPDAEQALHDALRRPWPILFVISQAKGPTIATYSRDGRSLMSAGADGLVRLRDAGTGLEWRAFRASSAVVDSRFSPDGRSVAALDSSGTLQVWSVDTDTGQARWVHSGLAARPGRIAWSPDGKLIAVASGSRGEEAAVVDQATGQVARVLSGHTAAVESVSWSLDGKSLVTASTDGTARVWDAGTGATRRTIQASPGGLVDAAFSPDERSMARVVTVGEDGSVRVWDSTTGQEVLSLPTRSRGTQGIRGIQAAAWSPDGSKIVTAGQDGAARVWDASGNEMDLLREKAGPNAVPVSSVEFSPDGNRVATANEDGDVHIWDLTMKTELPPLRPYGQSTNLLGKTNSGAYSPDGKSIATTGEYDLVRVWDADTGQQRLGLPSGMGDFASDVAWSPDGKYLAAGGGDGQVRVWDSTTGQERLMAGKLAANVLHVAWSPDGRNIAAGSREGSDPGAPLAGIWNAATGQDVAMLWGHSQWVSTVAFSPDGRTLLTASWDRTARIWDSATGRELFTLHGHTDTIDKAAWSPDGRWIATASRDKSARIWDASTGRMVSMLEGPTDFISGVAWSPDGRSVAIVSADGSLSIWDAPAGAPNAGSATATERMELRPGRSDKRDRLFWVAYAPDGQSLASGTEYNTVELWDAHTGKKRATFFQLRQRLPLRDAAE